MVSIIIIMYENIPPHLPSLCIPRISLDVTKDKIIDVLEKMHLGTILHIEFVFAKNANGDLYKKVFIRFSKWYDQDTRIRILQGKPVNIICDYNDPWFWKLFINKNERQLFSL